jgi:hypothetical protein
LPAAASLALRGRVLAPHHVADNGGGGCRLTVGHLGGDLKPVVEFHTENQFWQPLVSVKAPPASLRGFDE